MSCEFECDVNYVEGPETSEWRQMGYHLEPPVRKVTAKAAVRCHGCQGSEIADVTRIGTAPEIRPDGTNIGDVAINLAKAKITSCLKQK